MKRKRNTQFPGKQSLRIRGWHLKKVFREEVIKKGSCSATIHRNFQSRRSHHTKKVKNIVHADWKQATFRNSVQSNWADHIEKKGKAIRSKSFC
jgi:hypothetical protein